MKDPRRFYTYAYLRVDRTPYYIGKGQGNRIYHKRKGEVRPPKDKSRIIFLKQNLLEEDAFKHEKYMIAVFGRKDLGTGILHNRTDGGEGTSNPSYDIRKKIKEKRALQEITNETKLKISNSLKGRKRPPEVVEKIKKGRVGFKHTKETKQIIKEKRANQVFTEETRKKLSDLHKGKPKLHFRKNFKLITPNGKLVEGFGVKPFCDENNLNYACIRKVLNGTQSHHKGWTKPID